MAKIFPYRNDIGKQEIKGLIFHAVGAATVCGNGAGLDDKHNAELATQIADELSEAVLLFAANYMKKQQAEEHIKDACLINGVHLALDALKKEEATDAAEAKAPARRSRGPQGSVS